MSFREPLLLAALAVVPVALVLYWLAQRRRQRYAVRYPAVDVLATVAGKARGRHVPALLCLLALAALAVALARPERTVAVEQRKGTVMLVHDTSGSMRATDVQPDRLSAAREAARTLATTLPEEFRLGLVSFGSTARAALRADDGPLAGAAGDRHARDQGLHRDGRGASSSASRRSARRSPGRTAGRSGCPGAIVLLSDGKSTRGTDRSRSLGRRQALQDPHLRDRARHADRDDDAARRHDRAGAAGHDDAAAARAARPAGASSPRRPRATSRPSTPTSAAGSRRATRSRRSPRPSPAARSRCCSAGSSPRCCGRGGSREAAVPPPSSARRTGPGPGRSPTRSCARSTSPCCGGSSRSCPATTSRRRSARAPSSRRSGPTSRATTSATSTGT